MKLKKEIIEQLKKNNACIAAIADKAPKQPKRKNIGRSMLTVQRWIRTNDPWLLHPEIWIIISAYLKVSFEDMVVYEDHDFKPVS